MRKYKGGLAIIIVALSLMLSGCGVPMFELTDKEQELIINYSAYIVSKYNIYQKDGITKLPEEEPEKESETESETESEDTGTEDTQKPALPPITIEEAFAMAEGLKITHTDSYVSDHVKEGSGYAVNAGEGFSFYIMKLELENTTDKPIVVDHLLKHPTFTFKAGTVNTKSHASYLSADLLTYQGTIEPGAKVETILLFKIKATDADSIKNPILQITVDEVTKNVEL